MADNITVKDEATGLEVATDERSIGGVTTHVQRVDEQGSTAIASGQDTTVTTTAENIPARETRKRIVLFAAQGNGANVQVGTNGAENFPLPPGASVTLSTTAAIYYKAASGTQTLHWIEEYDA